MVRAMLILGEIRTKRVGKLGKQSPSHLIHTDTASSSFAIVYRSNWLMHPLTSLSITIFLLILSDDTPDGTPR